MQLAKVVDPFTGKMVFELYAKKGNVQICLNASLTLWQLRRWIADTLLRGARPKDVEHGLLLNVVEKALVSPSATYTLISATGDLMETTAIVRLAQQLGRKDG